MLCRGALWLSIGLVLPVILDSFPSTLGEESCAKSLPPDEFPPPPPPFQVARLLIYGIMNIMMDTPIFS